jgi:hypothetical protein
VILSSPKPEARERKILTCQSLIIQNIRLRSTYTFFIILSAARLSPLGTAVTTGLLYQPHTINNGDCRAIGGMKIGKGA